MAASSVTASSVTSSTGSSVATKKPLSSTSSNTTRTTGQFKRHGLVLYNCCRLKTLRHPSKSNMHNYRGYLCLFSFQKNKQEYPANSLTNSVTKFQHQSSLTIFLFCNKTWSHSSFGNGSRVKRVDASMPKTCYDIFGYHCLIP